MEISIEVDTITISVDEENRKSNPHINIENIEGDFEIYPEKNIQLSSTAFFSKLTSAVYRANLIRFSNATEFPEGIAPS